MAVKLYVDAGSDDEWGTLDSNWACGAVLEFPDGFIEAAKRLPKGTVNEAEYRGMIFGLELAKRFGAKKLLVMADSQLVIRQITGRYQCRKEHLKPLLAQVKRLAREFEQIEWRWIPREQNARADLLGRRVLPVLAGH